MATPGIAVDDASGLTTVEFKPTAAQVTASVGGCVFNAAKNVTMDDRVKLKSAIANVRDELSKSIDIVQAKRGRIGVQRKRLNDQLAKVNAGKNTVGSMYRLGAPIFQSCSDAATAAQGAKEGIDMLYSQGNELKYQLSILDVQDSNLSAMENTFTSSRDGLDQITLALG